jgi:hypothetical protein
MTNILTVNPVGLERLTWKFYFVYIAILVIECLCIWFFFVETMGPTLEEIAVLFDGPSAMVGDAEDQKKDSKDSKESSTHIEKI